MATTLPLQHANIKLLNRGHHTRVHPKYAEYYPGSLRFVKYNLEYYFDSVIKGLKTPQLITYISTSPYINTNVSSSLIKKTFEREGLGNFGIKCNHISNRLFCMASSRDFQLRTKGLWELKDRAYSTFRNAADFVIFMRCSQYIYNM